MSALRETDFRASAPAICDPAIGASIRDMLIDYARRYEVAYSFFDPHPFCSRRGRIRFVTHPDIGFEKLLSHIEKKWGFHRSDSAWTTHSDFYQDRFVPALRAHFGFYFRDERPRPYRLPDGCITVTVCLDIDSVADTVEFAHEHMIPDEADLELKFGTGCIEHNLAGK